MNLMEARVLRKVLLQYVFAADDLGEGKKDETAVATTAVVYNERRPRGARCLAGRRKASEF